jgi:hypothetical protein
MGRRRGVSIRMRSSILMTSAPKSARRRVATEPTPIQQKSATRIPASGPRRDRGVRSFVCSWVTLGVASMALFIMMK